MRFLYAREWVSAERAGVLFDLAIIWLVDHKVLLPGITTLERLISSVRERAALRVWQRLSTVVDPEQCARLDRLLDPSGKGNTRITTLERLRRSPTYASSRTMAAALTRLDEIRQLEMGTLGLGNISPSRIRTLAAYAVTSKASTLARLPDEQRAATLLCCARALEVTALDDSLDVLDLLLRDLLAKSERTGKKERLCTLRDLDAASLQLAERVEQLFKEERSDKDLRDYLEAQQTTMQASVATIYAIARPPDDNYYQEVGDRYKSVRQFFPQLLQHIEFQGNRAGQPVLKGLAFLKALEGVSHPSMNGAPLDFVSPGWKRYVAPYHHTPDRRYYTLCALSVCTRHFDIEMSMSRSPPAGAIHELSSYRGMPGSACVPPCASRSVAPSPQRPNSMSWPGGSMKPTGALLPTCRALQSVLSEKSHHLVKNTTSSCSPV